MGGLIVTATYENLRRGLYNLAKTFERLERRRGSLHHQLFWAPDPSRLLPADSWQRFIEKNQGRGICQQPDWEEWLVFPDGMQCSRYLGRGDKSILDDFIRAAAVGGQMLETLQDIQSEGGMPSDATLEFLSRHQSNGQGIPGTSYDWLAELHSTASRCYSSSLCEYSYNWMLPYERPGADPCDIAMEMSEGPLAYPLHPLTQTLLGDVRRASAEVIKQWLDLEEAEDPFEQIGGLSVFLPSTDWQSEAETMEEVGEKPMIPAMPHWDDSTRRLTFGGQLIKDFKQNSPNQVAILRAFQEEGWPPKIYDPLPPIPGIVSTRRLSDTILALNKSHKINDVLRFHGDGTGQGITWAHCPSSLIS